MFLAKCSWVCSVSPYTGALHILYSVWQGLMGRLRQKHSEGGTYERAQAEYHHGGVTADVSQEVDDGCNHSACPCTHRTHTYAVLSEKKKDMFLYLTSQLNTEKCVLNMEKCNVTLCPNQA